MADSPRGSSLPLWMLAVVALGGTVLFGLPRIPDLSPSASRPATTPATDTKSAAAPAATPGPPDPLVVVKDFFRYEPAPADPGRPPDPDLRLSLGKFALDFGPTARPAAPDDLAVYLTRGTDAGMTFEYLVVAVPDPVDSKFALEFDATVEAVQRAFEVRGFILHSSWVPWPRGPGGRAGAPTGAHPAHREYPGTLLFRHTRTATLALVCIVGENPISGPHKPALGRALDYFDRLRTHPVRWAGGEATTVRLVAPYYSGSQVRVVRTVEKWAAEPKAGRGGLRFRVISGSSTALTPDQFPTFPGTIAATVVPDRLVEDAVLSYLAGFRGTDLRENDKVVEQRVAILRESNTGFGAAADEAGQEAPAGPAGRAMYTHPLDRRQVVDLPFPSSVSRLAAELDATPKPAVGLPRTEFTEPRLKLPTGTQVDGFAPFDPESADTVVGQGLRATLSTVERGRYQYVGIVATDPRDVVFLNRVVRRVCPGVRVFTTEPSIAFLHPDEATQLRGVVVGGTYPLHPGAAWWATPRVPGGGGYAAADGPTVTLPNRRIPFPTQGAQGTYNAVLAQFGEHAAMIGYQAPLREPGRLTNRPAVWVSVVGQGGTFIPVHYFDEYDDTVPAPPGQAPGRYVHPAPLPEPATGHRPALPRVFNVPLGIMLGQLGAVALVGVLAFVLFPWTGDGALARAAGRWWRDWAAGRTAEEAAPPYVGRVYAAPGAWLWRGVMLAAVVLYAVPYTLPAVEVFTPCCEAPPWPWKGRHWVVAGLGLILLAELAVVVFLLMARSSDPHPGEDRPGDRLGYVGLAAVAAVPVFVTCVWWWRRSPPERFFLYVRTTDVPAGMSTLVPMGLVALAGFAIGWFSLRQADLARDRWMRFPYRKPWRQVLKARAGLNADLDHPLRFLASRRAVAVFLLLGVPYAVFLFWHGYSTALPSGEGPAWDWSMRAVFWLTTAAVVLALARFLIVWADLRDLLGAILRVPMVGAFERIPDEIGRQFGGYLYSRRPGLRYLGAVAWTLPQDARTRLAEAIDRDRPGLKWIFAHPPDRARRPHASRAVEEHDRAWLAGWLCREARAYLRELPGYWDRQTVNEAFGLTYPRGDAPAPAAPPAPAPAANRVEIGPGGVEVALEVRVPGPPADASAAGGPKRDAAWVRQAEQFVACVVVFYLGRYFAQLRQILYAFAVAAPLLLFATASFPFQPNRPRLDALVGLLVAVAIEVVYVLLQINRDGLISRITRTTPDRFTPDSGFLTSVATYVLPVLGLVLAQVFGVFRFVLDPILGLFQ